MEIEQQPHVRYRIKVEHTASGKTIWDGSVEFVDPGNTTADGVWTVDMDAALKATLDQSDALVAALQNRYGPKEQNIEQALAESLEKAKQS